MKFTFNIDKCIHVSFMPEFDLFTSDDPCQSTYPMMSLLSKITVM